MSAAQERSAATLAPEAAELVDAYFLRVGAALPLVVVGSCEESVEDLREHVLRQLEGGDGTSADVTRVLAELGSPEDLAAQCADAVTDFLPRSALAPDDRSPLSGNLLGIPYELRLPTGDRTAMRWWAPADPAIIVPRIFGLGWTINFGAVAVRLGLVQPDDEDVPFAEVPERWLALALVLPIAIAAGLAMLVAIYQSGLPAQVAIHYGPDGVADGFSSKAQALTMPVVMTLLGSVMAAWAWYRRRPPLSRVATGALATMLATISVGAYGQSVATANGAEGTTLLFTALAGAFVLPFAVLVILSRIGRAAEQRRDLDPIEKKGRVR